MTRVRFMTGDHQVEFNLPPEGVRFPPDRDGLAVEFSHRGTLYAVEALSNAARQGMALPEIVGEGRVAVPEGYLLFADLKKAHEDGAAMSAELSEQADTISRLRETVKALSADRDKKTAELARVHKVLEDSDEDCLRENILDALGAKSA